VESQRSAVDKPYICDHKCNQILFERLEAVAEKVDGRGQTWRRPQDV